MLPAGTSFDSMAEITSSKLVQSLQLLQIAVLRHQQERCPGML